MFRMSLTPSDSQPLLVMNDMNSRIGHLLPNHLPSSLLSTRITMMSNHARLSDPTPYALSPETYARAQGGAR